MTANMKLYRANEGLKFTRTLLFEKYSFFPDGKSDEKSISMQIFERSPGAGACPVNCRIVSLQLGHCSRSEKCPSINECHAPQPKPIEDRSHE